MNNVPTVSNIPATNQPGTTLTDREASHQELQAAINESNDILVQARNFGLFPDTLTVDRTQLTIARRFFLKTADVSSIRIEDILNVTVATGPIFGSITVFSRIPSIPPLIVNYLWRTDALRIKRITQGYIIAVQRDIDCASMTTHELVTLLEQLDQTDQQA